MQLKEIVYKKVEKVLKDKAISVDNIEVEKPKDEKFGDYSTNVAMRLAKILRKAPLTIATELKNELEKDDNFEKVEVVAPGFINFYFAKKVFHAVLQEILEKGEEFCKIDFGKGKKVMVEYVSANPTGYLHVGHGRGAVVGDVLANVLEKSGFNVFREYYINDAGSQVDKLSLSIYLRYKELLGEKVDFIEDGYHGQYVYLIAEEVKNEFGSNKNIDYEEVKSYFVNKALEWSLKEIRVDLEKFGIMFDNWYSEKSLYEDNKVNKTVDKLKSNGFIYENEGALWFKTTDFGDDKDRVVIREDGTPTYYASDIAYHEDKIKRGFEKLIDIWGADHHGYIKRVKSSIKALGYNENSLDVILVQIVNLFKNGEPFVMSKRTGNFITLRELIEEVGKDVARIYFIMRSSDSQFDFDLDVAKRESSDNPAYYIQYAHARICSIIRNSEIELDKVTNYELNLLVKEEEVRLIKKIDEFKEMLEDIATNYEVHKIVKYADEVATLLHGFYNKHKVLSEDKELTISRLKLLKGVLIIIRNVLNIVGASAPERM